MTSVSSKPRSPPGMKLQLSPKASAIPAGLTKLAKLQTACHRDSGCRWLSFAKFTSVPRPRLAHLRVWCLRLRTGRWQHRKGLPSPQTNRSLGHHDRRLDDELRACHRCRGDRGVAGIVHDALRPFAIGMDADDRQIAGPFIQDGEFWKICVQRDQQREQHASNEGKISHQGHSLLRDPPRQEHLGARVVH